MLVRPVGARAVLLEVEDLDQVTAWRQAVAALVSAGFVPPPAEVVPGACTLLLDGVDAPAVARRLSALPTPDAAQAAAAGPLVEVPVVYDGPDLAEIARLWGTTEREVVRRHTGTVLRVAFCGFAPGFPYLVGLPSEVPRRATPRPVVPAGSVALAGRYCGIYPTSSPGGWQLLGRTGVRLFDPDRDQPALLPPGARVRFVEAASLPTPAPRPAPVPVTCGARALTVLRPGALTTVQDTGRRGHAHLGVPRAGALDAAAARLANRLVGNPEDAAVLETTVDGVALQPASTATVAVTGATAPVTVGGRAASWGVAVGVPTGAVLDVGRAAVGVRSYIAVAGGLSVPAVLGSRSTDTLSGLGPARLAPGDVLAVGTPSALPPAVDFTLPPVAAEPVVLRLTPGPRDDWFVDRGVAVLLSQQYALSPLSNRVGARLTGPVVPRLRAGELESEGMVLGAVQVPPDGQPVVLLADHPTTGGYPVVGVVDPGDLAALAQARPGAAVRFVADRRTRWPV